MRSFGDTPPPAVPDTTATPRNQFLQGSADTLPTTGLAITGGAVTPLNLAIATFDGIALGGQAADGVGFFDVAVMDSVGSIEAFVQQDGVAYHHLTGTYDDNGVIKGEVDLGNFTAGTRTQDGTSRIAGVLTGLIGQDGAVGAFISGRVNAYSGGVCCQ